MSSPQKAQSSWKQTALGYHYLEINNDNQLEKTTRHLSKHQFLHSLLFSYAISYLPSAAASQCSPHPNQTSFTATTMTAHTVATMNKSLLLEFLSGSAKRNFSI